MLLTRLWESLHTLHKHHATKAIFIYREDVAELFIRMCQAETLKHFAYNSGGHACSFEELASIVKEFIPEAQFSFGEPIEHAIAPFLVSDQRAVKEFGFKRRDLRQGILDHINEARKEANLPPIR